MSQLLYIDFIPRLIQSELLYSTLSLTCSSGGPKYDEFSTLVSRANDWLASNSLVIHFVHVEVLEVDGIYSSINTRQTASSKDDESTEHDVLSSFLKIIRIWYMKKTSDSSASHSGQFSTVHHLDYVHILPARLESPLHSSQPTFESLSSALDSFNVQLQELGQNHTCNKSRLISMQTCSMRFSGENCRLDPERTFWMIGRRGGPAHDVHACFYFTLFFARSKDSRHLGTIHKLSFEDFAPECHRTGGVNGRRRSMHVDGTNDVIEDVSKWVSSSASAHKAHVINMQTFDHHTYFRCARDTPGYERKTLSNPYYRISLVDSSQFTKIIRVYFCTCSSCQPGFQQQFYSTSSCSTSLSCTEAPSALGSTRCLSLFQKSFHVDQFIPLSQLNMSWSNLTMPTEHHRSVLSKITEWINTNGVSLVGIETLKVCLADGRQCHHRRITADDSYLQSSSYTGQKTSAVYAIRVFVSCKEETLRATSALNAEPKFAQVKGFSSCVIV